MKIRRPFAVFLWVLALGLSAVPAHASLDLGKVDEYKLKSFSEYFGQYFDVADVEFDDKEFELKLRDEAADINRWLADPANWPAKDKIKPAMLSDAGMLFLYFANAGLENAQANAVSYLAQASAANPKDHTIPLRLARIAAKKGPEGRTDVIRYGEQALAANAEASAKENIHYHLANAYYHDGDFAKAYASLKKQAEINAEFENTANMVFAWDIFVEVWGRVPDKIVFKTQEDGRARPEPADGV